MIAHGWGWGNEGRRERERVEKSRQTNGKIKDQYVKRIEVKWGI